MKSSSGQAGDRRRSVCVCVSKSEEPQTCASNFKPTLRTSTNTPLYQCLPVPIYSTCVECFHEPKTVRTTRESKINWWDPPFSPKFPCLRPLKRIRLHLDPRKVEAMEETNVNSLLTCCHHLEARRNPETGKCLKFPL